MTNLARARTHLQLTLRRLQFQALCTSDMCSVIRTLMFWLDTSACADSIFSIQWVGTTMACRLKDGSRITLMCAASTVRLELIWMQKLQVKHIRKTIHPALSA